jgi:hypothetical protein
VETEVTLSKTVLAAPHRNERAEGGARSGSTAYAIELVALAWNVLLAEQWRDADADLSALSEVQTSGQ